MRYYFHIMKDQERLRDPDGEEFASLACAREEAAQCARDLIAEELRCGRAVPAQWRIQIAHDDETILDTVSFASILNGEEIQRSRLRPRFISKHHHELMARALATSNRARTSHAEITRHLTGLRDNLRSLAELNRAFARHQRNG
jgi:hypothetical protein